MADGVEEVGSDHQLGGHVIRVTIGVNFSVTMPGGKAFIRLAAKFISSRVGVGGNVGVAQQIFRGLAVAQGQGAVSRAKKAGVVIFESAAVRLDPDIGGQFAVAGADEFCDGRSEVGIRHAAIFRIAAFDFGDGAGVIFVLGMHAANDRHVVHLFGGVRKQFAEMHAGDARGDGAEGAAESGVGFGVPAFELAHAAVEPDEDDLLALSLELRCECGTEDGSESAHGPRRRECAKAAENLATREQMVRAVTGERVFHWFASAFTSSNAGTIYLFSGILESRRDSSH